VTPKQYLARHELTAHLKHLGITRKQLDGVEYRIRFGTPFHEWAVVSQEPWPDDLLLQKHVWCAFRWLIISNPPSSPDKDSVWNYVSWYLKGLDESKGRNARRLEAAQKKANKNRKSKADQAALDKYRAWKRTVTAVLSDMDEAERLRRYFKVKQPLDRQRRRLRMLLKNGGI
jgi:hypothetical protein